MSWRSLIGGAFAATAIVGMAACYGSVGHNDGSSEPQVVGQHAQLVEQKREWLQKYDQHCDVCFQAFKLCGVGAADDQATKDACKTALDSCVKGGLIAGNVDVDAGAAAGDGDANGGNQIGNGSGFGGDGDDNVDVDAGVAVGGDVDAGSFNGGNQVGNGSGFGGDGDAASGDGDVDGDVDEASEEAQKPNDGDQNGQPGDQVKQQLVDDVKVCLADAKTCLDAADADKNACLQTLEQCVSDALDKAFSNVCTVQRHRCQSDNSSEAEQDSVNQVCGGGRHHHGGGGNNGGDGDVNNGGDGDVNNGGDGDNQSIDAGPA
jgi:hypothetical protein